MASSDVLSQTLSSITAIKLDELSNQRSVFEEGKAALLGAVGDESDQHKKLEILLGDIETLAVMGKLNDNPTISLKNAKQFLEQARCDPSVSNKLLQDWESKLEKELDIHSLKYEYASLYGRLVNEWLSVSSAANVGSDADKDMSSSAFESIGRKEMYEQRVKWEEYVFKPLETDVDAINLYLKKMFNSTKSITTAYNALRASTSLFERGLTGGSSFDVENLKGVIEGLLRSDLVTDDKRKALKDFVNNKVVLAEIADVLNMRMANLDKWQWDPKGTGVEQRRQLNGRYRFYHDEDLLQTILLRYIGVQWSVHFKARLCEFQNAVDVWKSSAIAMSPSDRIRRGHLLGQNGTQSRTSVEAIRSQHFVSEILLEQLTEEVDEQRGGYDDDTEHQSDTRKSGQQITQTLLHYMATEIIMKTRLGEEVNVVRTDFKWFGPSLSHSTMFAVLSFFGVSDRWVGFFRRTLEAPMKFTEDGPDAPIQIRKRGTPISGPLSDMLGETVLFCLDFAFNQITNGARMYRMHDDIWFLSSSDKVAVQGWKAMAEFAELFGLEFNEEKTGSVKITRKVGNIAQLPASLPKGDVRWGFLKLDSATGRFLIDRGNVDVHVEELRRQLGACKSIFDWIQAWNVYGARFFANNFGKPAHCFGRDHVDSMLDTFAYIQSKLFASTGGSVTSTLQAMISERFNVSNIPEGYLYYPSSFGGLDLKNPFVSLYLIRNLTSERPDNYMDLFFTNEETAYRTAKTAFENDNVPLQIKTDILSAGKLDSMPFMSFEEYTKYREQNSQLLVDAYNNLITEPKENEVDKTSDVGSLINERLWARLTSYQRWVIQLYAPDMISRFGGLNVVEKGLLPTGMVSMFRESRFKWQG